MDLKQIARAAVNRWRNKSFSPNETASEPTGTQTEVITASTESPATTVITLTVSGTNEPPRVFTVTASSFSISYQGNRMFINVQTDTVTDVEARPAGDAPAKDVLQAALDAASEVPTLPEAAKAEVLPESSASTEMPASSEAPLPLETQASREEETAPVVSASPETSASSEAPLSLETQASHEEEAAPAVSASTETLASSEVSLPLETQASREEETAPGVLISTEPSTTPDASTKENTPARMNADIISFLNRNCELRFNVLTECTECRLKGADSFHPLTERIRNMLCVQAQDAGISCWDRDLNRLIESARVPDYHPFRGYFAALPAWDGRDRLTDLAARVSTDEKWRRHFHRWMLGLAAQWAGFGDGMHAHSVAPLLVSDQQGMGKSTFCRALMPAELTAYYTDSVNLNQQDKLERHLIEMGLINLDEFDRIPASRQPQLKNTMQLSALSIRRAYKKHTSNLPRVASFIGTSNSRELLTDHTGSRRFICVMVERPIDVSDIDHAQIYAQLKAELEAGEQYWFSKEEEAEIQLANQPFYRTSPAEEVIRCHFRAPKEGEASRLCSLPELAEELRRRCPGQTTEIKLRALAQSLVSAGIQRIHTSAGNRYRVVDINS